MTTATQPSIRVSVVVPVYNPGPHLEALIDSLAEQTMSQDEFEVIFSDDGSTDATPQRLDQLKAERPNVKVRHDPNSGWPGRPRNLGTDMATGRYVFFVDQDDWLGREALERLTNYAEANEADVAFGRYAGHRRGVARAPFKVNQPRATLENTPLMDSLVPHKMFRREFLIEHNLRFPEGRRRLEDHVFVTEAYLLAKRIAVLSDYHCYFHVRRDDEGNAGYQQIDPAGYYGNVREVVDVALRYTEPGPRRDKVLRRSLRQEMLGRLDGYGFLKQDPEYQQALFDESRRIAVEMMPLSVDAGLSPPQRVRAVMLRANRLDDLKVCVAHYVGHKAIATLNELSWTDQGELMLGIEASMVDKATEEPWKYIQDGERAYLTEPSGLSGDFPREVAECTKELQGARMQVVLLRRADSEEWVVPTIDDVEVHRDGDRMWVSHSGTATIDFRTIGGGRPLSAGTWDVFVRVAQTGWSKDARLGSRRADKATAGRRPGLVDGTMIVPYWTENFDNLSLQVDASSARMTGQLHPRPVDVALSGGASSERQFAITLPIAVAPGSEPAATLRWQASTQDEVVDRAATVSRTAEGGVTVVAPLPDLPPADWDLLLALDVAQWPQPRALGLKLSIATTGSESVEMATRSPKRAAGASAPTSAAGARTPQADDITDLAERRKEYDPAHPSLLVTLRRRIPLPVRRALIRLRENRDSR